MKHKRVDTDLMCKCSHPLSIHHHGKTCLYVVDPKRAKYCKCDEFRFEVEVKPNPYSDSSLSGPKGE